MSTPILRISLPMLLLLAGPAAQAAQPPDWTYCAEENTTCNFSGTTQVRFGAYGSYSTITASGPVKCNVQVFPDPLPNYYKTCEFDAANLAPPPEIWIRCANEDQVCSFPGTRRVRYGDKFSYLFLTATSSIDCSNAVFGDPLWGQSKYCSYLDAPPLAEPEQHWTFCAQEDGVCNFSGTRDVRYGLAPHYSTRTASDSVSCSNGVFGDPVFGVDKICEYGDILKTAAGWSEIIEFPIVPVAAANLPDGKILTWSAFAPTTFGGDKGRTFSSVFDPLTRTTTLRLVSETGHDMFCPGVSMLQNGRILVSGGSSSVKTSIFNAANNTWSAAAPMNIGRGYQTNVTLADGSVLTLGGSWSGLLGGKNAERWTSANGWTAIPNLLIAPLTGPDPAGVWRGDNHLWLFTAANGKVFHAGPAAEMHWLTTSGTGSIQSAGHRGDDVYSMNGNAVMFDIGKILTTGGAPAYEDSASSPRAYLIDISSGSARVRKLAPMHYSRAMHNSVVLPSGEVLVTGGQSHVKIFSDDMSVLMAEMWNPATEKFSTLTPMTIPRNYHSFAILLPDARVLVGGGGLCDFDCSVNHLNAQVFTPPYLYNANGSLAARPQIASTAASVANGGTLIATSNMPISRFALMRLSAVTHSINSDQRRIPLASTLQGAGRYALGIPANKGVAPPGYYMLFGIDSQNVPSHSISVRIQ